MGEDKGVADLTRYNIAYIRTTKRLTDAEVASYVAAQQRQLDEQFEPAWGIGATCTYYPPRSHVPGGVVQVFLQDHTKQAGAYGFHDHEGFPRGYVAVADTIDDGNSWTVTASHETLETLADPTIDRTVTVDGLEYAFEVADAPEDDQFAYACQGLDGAMHLLSAFVLPSWFDPDGLAPFSYPPVLAIDAPFALAEGGYIGVRTLPDGEWDQRLARGKPGKRTAKAATSRTKRRFAG